MWAAFIFHAFVASAVVSVTHSFDPNMKCVVDAGGKSVFSVLIQDGGSIKSTEGITVKFKSDSSQASPDENCEAAEITREYFTSTEITGAGTNIEHTQAATTGTADSHEWTRIHVNMRPCSLHTEEDVAATASNAKQKKHKYEAELSMSPVSWASVNVFKLMCTFEQSSTADELVIESELVDDLQDSGAQYVANLKIYRDASGGGTEEITENGGKFEVELGQTLYLKASIEGDLDVETAFQYCTICQAADCTTGTNQDLIVQYNAATTDAADETMNCLHTDVRDNTRFVITVPDGATKHNAELQFPAFRYTESTGNSLFLKCGLAICKKDADSPCRKTCQPAGYTRRRRSADASKIKPLETTAKIGLTVQTPKGPHCPSPVTARGTSRMTCTNGTKVGSICRQDCETGFAANLKGFKTGMRVCQEEITESIGPFYFGMKPAWTPHTSGCIDINECLQKPCPEMSYCQNTIGSYKCVWKN